MTCSIKEAGGEETQRAPRNTHTKSTLNNNNKKRRRRKKKQLIRIRKHENKRQIFNKKRIRHFCFIIVFIIYCCSFVSKTKRGFKRSHFNIINLIDASLAL